jgi:hypothetical protein
MAIPIILCIDVEPDPRLTDLSDPAPWKGFEACYTRFSLLRKRLAAATGSPVHYNWYLRMDPQVADTYGSAAWVMKEYATEFQDLVTQGDDIGLHTHNYRWETDKQSWLVDNGNPEWVRHCVDMSFDAYEEVFNKSCDAFRMGDKFMSQAAMARIEERGARFDLTVEPGSPPQGHGIPSERFTGSDPDYRDVPSRPYQRAVTDWKKGDPSRTDGLTIIPLSAGHAETWKGRAKRAVARVLGQHVDSLDPLTLRLNLHSPSVCLIMDRLLNETERPYLAFLIRTDIGIKDRETAQMDRAFAHIMQHRYAHDFAFATPHEAMSHIGYESLLE